MTNAYPELPALAPEKTEVPMQDVIAYLRGLSALTEVKRVVFVIFRNESANGTAGVNNNYIGAQADGARWPDKWTPHIVGTVIEAENGTGKQRIFLAFDRWETSMDLLVDEVTRRGLFIDRVSIFTEDELVADYYREWVTGDPHAMPPQPVIEAFRSMYGQAMALFRDGPAATVVAAEPTADDLNADVLAGKQIPEAEG